MAKAVQYHADADVYMIWCPGCGHKHYIAVRDAIKHGITWQFNFDLDRPSFHPSVRYSIKAHSICHFFIKEGEIQFQNDCEHALAGQNVPLLDYKEWPRRK